MFSGPTYVGSGDTQQVEVPRRRVSLWLVLSMVGVLSGSTSADIGDGVVDQYHKVDPEAPVPTELPELTVADLRKLTGYDGLQFAKGRLRVAGRGTMRSIEPHPREKGILMVTGDRFQFSTFADGRGVGIGSGASRPFFWIKYESKEQFAGRYWVKDLILLPFDPKTREMKWPFWQSKHRMPGHQIEYPGYFVQRTLETPLASESVVGTIDGGRVHYLVLSIFGEYASWSDVVSYEYISLRGKGDAEVAAFHAKPRNRNEKGYAALEKRVPGVQWGLNVADRDAKSAQGLYDEVPTLLGTRANAVDPGLWKDLLQLEGDGRPVQSVDARFKGRETFAELLDWAEDQLTNPANGSIGDFTVPLDELPKERISWISAARLVRYAFRRQGFPCRLIAVERPVDPYPSLLVQVYFPAQDVLWTVDPWKKHIVFRAQNAELERFTHVTTFGRRGPLVFDCHRGGKVMRR